MSTYNSRDFFFKQKTAYEMRISDWSSDVCSSDLQRRAKCQRDRLRLLGGRREFGGGDGGEPPVGGRQPGPSAGEIGGGERIGDRATADRAGIMPPAPPPCLELAAVDSHPAQQQLHLALRVHHDRTHDAARIAVGAR